MTREEWYTFLAQSQWALIHIDAHKRPIQKNWTKQYYIPITAQEAQSFIEQTGRYGIVTGKASGIIVLDIDHRADSATVQNGLAAIIQAASKEALNTFTVRTPSGGLHLYYALPKNTAIKTRARIDLGIGKDIEYAIDVRAEGGQVVGPYSVTEKGTYEIVRATNIAPLPTALMQLLVNKHREPTVTHNTQINNTQTRLVQYGLNWLTSKGITRVHTGQRDEILTQLAGYLYNLANDVTELQTALAEIISSTFDQPDEFMQLLPQKIQYYTQNFTKSAPSAKNEVLVTIDGLTHSVRSVIQIQMFLAEWLKKQGYWYMYETHTWYQHQQKIDKKKLLAATNYFWQELIDQLVMLGKKTPSVHTMNTLTKQAIEAISYEIEKEQAPGTLATDTDTHIDLSTVTMHKLEYTKYNAYTDVAKQEAHGNIEDTKFYTFLKEAMHNNTAQIQLLQEVFGAALWGYASRLKKAVFIYGPADLGKSLFTKVMQAVFRGYAVALPEDIVLQKKSRSMESTARLVGKRLFLANEVSKGTLDTGMLKQMITGDSIVAEYKFSHQFEFQPNGLFVYTSNHAPTIQEIGDALWQKLLIIEWDYEKKKHDPYLLDYILEHELPAIFKWLTEGAKAVKARGFEVIVPESLRQQIQQQQFEADIVAQFAHDVVQKDRNRKIKAQDLYLLYVNYALQNGQQPHSKRNFIRLMREKGYKTSIQQVTWFVNIALKEDLPTEVLDKHKLSSIDPVSLILVLLRQNQQGRAADILQQKLEQKRPGYVPVHEQTIKVGDQQWLSI